MKSTKYIYQLLMVLLLAHFPLYAQYTGGSANGTSLNELTSSLCGNPAHFYAYFGGNGDGGSVYTLTGTSCGTPPGGFAYLGGNGDGAAVQTISNTSCGLPPGAYAYLGGNGDGQGVHTLMDQVCPIPPQFYAYFGAAGSGAAMDKNRYCAIVLPVADFSASPTTACVNTDVTFTNLSTDAVAWEWTFTGGTLVAPSTINSQNPVVRYATAGTYAVTLKALNEDGNDIETKTAYITIGATATITATSPGSRCGTGSVTIGATSGGIVRWYNAATGGTLLGTGAAFNTPSISTNTTYYAEAYNGCVASSRTAVLATVNTVPTITGTPASRCGAGVLILSTSPSSGTVSWYDAPSGGNLLSTGSTFTTPSITTTTTYYAETTTAQSCTSTRIAVVATINNVPTITSTTPASRCGSGIATIQAVSTGTLNWYAAATGGSALGSGSSFTPSVISTTTFYVDATTNGCTSTRTPVAITVNSIPTITTTSPGSRCDAGEVTLAATASTGTLSWYNASTGGTLLGTGITFNTPSISSSTNYYVETYDGTCTSPRTAVLATINSTPSITSTTPSQVCGSGAVTLSAIASPGTLNWYDAATGGSILGTGNTFTTPSITETTTFYVEAVNTSCTSVRVPVLATVNAIPAITSTTDATICANEIGTLSATANTGTIYWYSLPSGGISFATGNSIPVSGASATFYVEAVSNGCTSARVPVTYISIALPVITSVSPATRCDAGTLTLSAVASEGTISWFDVPSGGTALGNGSIFTTPSISGTTTYYVESTNGTCTSTRTAVTASIIPTAAPTGFANQTFCEGETVGMLHLEGAAIQWYDAPVSGNLLSEDVPLVAGTTYYASQTQTGCESPTRLAITVSLGNCLGTENFEVNALQLYPNPTFDVVNISSIQPISKVVLYNMLGQHIQTLKVDATEAKLDLSPYAAGAYFVKVSVDHQIKTYKVIKK